jgi:hypothetical protein
MVAASGTVNTLQPLSSKIFYILTREVDFPEHGPPVIQILKTGFLFTISSIYRSADLTAY